MITIPLFREKGAYSMPCMPCMPCMHVSYHVMHACFFSHRDLYVCVFVCAALSGYLHGSQEEPRGDGDGDGDGDSDGDCDCDCDGNEHCF